MKWLSLVFICFFIAFPAQSRTLQEIKNSGKIIVGAINSDTKKPVNFTANGRKQGIDIELMKIIAGELGVRLEKRDLAGLPERITSLTSNKVDLVISSFSITSKRLEKIDFSLPYLTTGIGVLMRNKFKGNIKTFNDLTTQRLGVIEGSTAESLFKEFLPDIPLKVIYKKEFALADLARGRIDGYANDLLFLSVSALEESNKYYTLEGTLSADPYGIGISKGSHALKQSINRILTKLKDNGELERILNKYTGSADPSGASSVKTSSSSNFTIYTVKSGDTLSRIASHLLGDVSKWVVIYADNKGTISYPNQINIGQKLKIRQKATARKSPTIQPRQTVQSKSISMGGSKTSLVEKLKIIKELYDGGLIDPSVYKKKQEEIIDSL